ncbi:MAG: hypothetical protein HWD59_02445 [Coxiellaceae bacterium]|nr:MAG: hypothetical protein HWD59_02445 [Coxiellaceae bacterium]
MSQYKPAMLYQGSKYVELPINLNELHGWLQISAKMAIKFIDSLEYSGELQNIDMNNIATTKFYKFYSDKNTAFIIPLHAHFNLTAIQELINAAILQAMACHGWQGLEFSLWQPDFQEPLENASVGYKDLLEYANNFYIACYNITMGLNEGLQSISDQSMQAIYTVAKKQMHLKGLTRSSMPKTKQNTTEEKPTEELPSNSRHV